MREQGDRRSQLCERTIGAANGVKYLQRRDNPVSGRVAVQTDDVTRVFPTDLPIVLEQLLKHITVTDCRAFKRNLELGQGLLHSEVCHQGANHAALQQAGRAPVGGDDVYKLVAIV